MDQPLCLRTADRRLARPPDSPRPHPGDEWRELSAPAEQTASAYRDRRDGGEVSRGMISGRLILAGSAEGFRDVTLCSGSHAAYVDQPGLIAAISHTVNLSETPQAQGASGAHP